MRRRRRWRRGSRGAAIAEMALLLPVLCLILLITIDYARLFSALATLSDCARDGALYYANHTTDTQANISQAALADASNLTSPAPTVSAPAATTDSSGYTYVQVTVSYQFSTLFNFSPIPSPTTLSRKVVMLVTP